MLHVTKVRRLKKAARSVNHVKQERLAMDVKTVHWDLLEQEMTPMLPNASNVNWVKRRRPKVVRPNAIHVIPVHLAATKVSVPTAPKVGFRIPKVHQHVSNAKSVNRTSTLKRRAVVVV